MSTKKKWNLIDTNLYERDGRFKLRLYHTCPKTGNIKSKQATLPKGRTEEEARQILAQHKIPKAQPVHRPTLADYAERWIEAKAKAVGKNTLDKRISHLSHHILPVFGEYFCDTITREDVQAWCEDVKTKTDAKGELYSRDTLLNWWGTFAEVLRDMAADLRLDDSTRRVRAPLVKRKPKRVRETLTRAQLGELVDLAKRTNRYPEIIMLAYTGMRAGEMYGLKWNDIDEAAEIIHINRSHSRGVWVEGGKTGVGRRVYLHPAIASALREHRLDLIREQNPGLQDDLVFPSKIGTPRSSGSLRKTFATISEVMGLEHNISGQVLRRTFNTLMGQAQVDAFVIRAQMGHSSEAMTEYYTHVEMDRIKVAALTVIDGCCE